MRDREGNVIKKGRKAKMLHSEIIYKIVDVVYRLEEVILENPENQEQFSEHRNLIIVEE